MIRVLSRFARARKGAALVEFSLLAPILILLMAGLAEFGNALRQYHVMEKGVRDAGRYLSRVAMTGCTVNAGAITTAQNLVLTGRTSGGTYLISDWTDVNTVAVTVPNCIANSPRVYRGQDNIAVIQITATAPYEDLGMLSVIGFDDGIELTVSHQQVWIGH